ncbi:tetratricopeptide repeat protein [Desulfonatronovibrio magnus]|uniref:O-linked N-acetylglucosamine transferase, SPINDLY family protein n=1 Tax=Desulfonatronovibrio magnus TaxID=698827 RepID=UPI0005EBE35E|nr:tetratricopeptide repeat protein [Desulfonatronovibrio magnus]
MSQSNISRSFLHSTVADSERIVPFPGNYPQESRVAQLKKMSMLIWFRTNVVDNLLQLGVNLHQAGRLAEAGSAYEAILSFDPEHPHALHLSGALLSQTGHNNAAIKRLKQAFLFLPEDPGVLSNLAVAYKCAGRLKKAVLHYQRALCLRPDFQPALKGLYRVCVILGDMAHEKHRRREALAWYELGLKFTEDKTHLLNNKAIILQEMGCIDEALEYFRRALIESSSNPQIFSNYLLAVHNHPETRQKEYFSLAKKYDQGRSSNYQQQGLTKTYKKYPIKLGYISGDFSDHAVSTFIMPLLQMHDPQKVKVTIFSNGIMKKSDLRPLRRLNMTIHDIHHLSDHQALSLIRNQKLDLLVDLSGHTARNRLPVLARRAASKQAVWLGYFNTTGLHAMDYLLADERCCPEGSEKWYSEKIMRLPNSFFCYTPNNSGPAPSHSPCLAGKPFTFGCFNETNKLNLELIKLWAEILNRAENSRLLLKAKPLADKSVVGRYRKAFASFGISSDRLMFEGASPHKAYLKRFRDVDLCLDPFPYNGGTVTCDSLWMGVPVLSLAGEMMVSRMGFSLLHAAGLREWVCFSREEYIQKAVYMAAAPQMLERMRKNIRQTMASSPLCNGKQFMRDLLRSYCSMLGMP